MRETRLKAFIFVTFLITTFGSAFSKSIPFTLKRGVPEIEVVINDTIKATFILDTGADQVYIDRTFAEKNDLLFGGKMPVRPSIGINDKVEAFQIFLKSLKVDEINQRVVNAVVIDLQALVSDTSRGLPDGVLGFSFLKNQKILINYMDSTLELLTGDSILLDQKIAAIPLVRNRHLITVSATINDSIEAKMILDTGASHSLLTPALAKRLGLEDSSMVNKIKLGGKVTTANLPTLVRSIDAIGTAVEADEIGGVLGSNFLCGRQLVIDYINNQLLIFSNQ